MHLNAFQIVIILSIFVFFLHNYSRPFSIIIIISCSSIWFWFACPHAPQNKVLDAFSWLGERPQNTKDHAMFD